MAIKTEITSENKIAENRHASFDYEILEKFEAGIVLAGSEAKSLRENHAQITDSFCMVRNRECWLNNMHIPPYKYANIQNPDPDRKRKLLLHKKEIVHLQEKSQEKGLSIVPLAIYYANNGRVKVQIALCRGKKKHDKRAALKTKQVNREIERELKMRSR